MEPSWVHQWQSIAPNFDRDLFLRIQPMSVNQDGQSTMEFSFQSLFLGRANRLVSLMQENLAKLG